MNAIIISCKNDTRTMKLFFQTTRHNTNYTLMPMRFKQN